MNEFTLMGRVGRAPEERKMGNGKTVCNLSLATDNGKDKSTGQKRPPSWHSLSAFDKTADTIVKYVKQGQMILVKGRITYKPRKIGDKEITQTNLVIDHFEFTGDSRKSEGRTSDPAPVNDDDVPF